MADLSNPESRKALAQSIKSDINAYCAEHYDDGHRSHLGASTLGEECDRKLWLQFRWAGREKFDGRMQRLFQMGHNFEPRAISYLQAIGFTVYQHDDNGKQFRIAFANGHGGGSCDGVAIKDGEKFLLEFKTSGTGANFTGIESKGVRVWRPKHWVQMCVYGVSLNLKYALYMVENKNDSDITVEVAELDWRLGEQYIARGERIINGPLPAKFAQSPAHAVCRFCSFAGVCHHGEAIERNCRSCVNSVPIENKAWGCRKWNAVIPAEEIARGCQEWVGVL